MIKASEKIKAILTESTALQAEINGAHYWGLAPANEKPPFITYNIIETTVATKDRSGDYDVHFFTFHSSMYKAAEIAEILRTAVITAGFKPRGGQSGLADNQAKEGYIQLNFNFKIRL